MSKKKLEDEDDDEDYPPLLTLSNEKGKPPISTRRIGGRHSNLMFSKKSDLQRLTSLLKPTLSQPDQHKRSIEYTSPGFEEEEPTDKH